LCRAGGLGGHLIQKESTLLDLQLGAAANREFFSTDLNRTSAEIPLGEEFVRKFPRSRHCGRNWCSIPRERRRKLSDHFDTSVVAAMVRLANDGERSISE